jgi:hypothetical protein
MSSLDHEADRDPTEPDICYRIGALHVYLCNGNPPASDF